MVPNIHAIDTSNLTVYNLHEKVVEALKNTHYDRESAPVSAHRAAEESIKTVNEKAIIVGSSIGGSDDGGGSNFGGGGIKFGNMDGVGKITID